jgi:type VI protein secretion system component Hcp
VRSPETNARITEYNIGSTGQRDLTSEGLPRVEVNGSGSPVEELALTFEKIKVTYTPMKADGTADAPIVFSWDVVKNGTY